MKHAFELSDARAALKSLAYAVGSRLAGPADIADTLADFSVARILAMHAQLKVRGSRDAIIQRVTRWALSFDRPWEKLFEHLIEAAVLPEGVQGTATIYVSSVIGNDNANNGSTWTLANASIAGGLADATDATFNFVYVDSAHTFTAGAAITYNVATSGTAVFIVSVDRNGSTTTGHNGHLAGAVESVGAASAAFTIGTTPAGIMYFKGLALNASVNNSSLATINISAGTVAINVHFTDCTLSSNTTSAIGGVIFLGQAEAGSTLAGFITFANCTINLPDATTATPIQFRKVICTMAGVTIGYSGANKPTACFAWTAAASFSSIDISDSDLSGYDTTGGNLFTITNFNAGTLTITNCKRHATPGFITGTWPLGNRSSITAINVSATDTVGTYEYYTRLGTATRSTSIYADSGFKLRGVNQSLQVVTTAACSEQEPFSLPWFFQPSTFTSAVNVDVHIAHDSATDLTDRDIWLDVSYIPGASFPLGSTVTSRNTNPFSGTPVDLDNVAEAWTGITGFTNQNKQRIRKAITPAEGSTIRGRVSTSATSKTFYLDPAMRIAA